MMRNNLKIIGCSSISTMTSSKEAIINCTIGNIWLCSRFYTIVSRSYSRSQLNMSSLFCSKKANITLAWNIPGEIMHPALDTECQEKGRLEETSNNIRGLETMTDIRKLTKMDCFNKKDWWQAWWCWWKFQEKITGVLFLDAFIHSLQMTLNWDDQPICLRAGLPFWGMLTHSGNQWTGNFQHSTRTNAKPCSCASLNNAGWGDWLAGAQLKITCRFW